jgi:thiamine pyrophosphokinase
VQIYKQSLKGKTFMHIVVFAGGTLCPGSLVDEAIHTADMIIAADSGAATALQYGCTPSIILGDFDSLPSAQVEEAIRKGCQLVRASSHKDETDTELALREARQRGATSISLLGALGGTRVEHTLANFFLLTDFVDIPLRIIDGPSVSWLLTGPGSSLISGMPQDFLSLFPFTALVTGIDTTNLAYPLDDASLRFGVTRGISNELTDAHARVSIREGSLLIIHTRR